MTEQLSIDGDLASEFKESNILIKHSATIQITNRISMVARRISNVLLANARKTSPGAEVHEIELADLRRQIRYNSRNVDHLYVAIRSLFDTKVRYNIFNKDSAAWGELHLLAEYQVTDDKILRYAYPPSIRSRLMSPNLYARFDLDVQNRLASKHSLALWEYLTDALGAKRGSATLTMPIDEFRELMNLQADEYEDFCDLNKRIIKRSVGEINQHTKLRVAVDVRRKGRKPEHLILKVSRANPRSDESQRQDEAVPMKSGRSDSLTSTHANSLLQILTSEFDLTAEAASQICRTYDSAILADNLTLIRSAIRKGRVRNISAYTISALKQNLDRNDVGVGVAGKGANDFTNLSDEDGDKEEKLQYAITWYKSIGATRQQRLLDLFIAGLGRQEDDEVRDVYMREGPNHPRFRRAFFLHVASKIGWREQ